MSDFVTGQLLSMEQDTPYHGLMAIYYYGFFLQDDYRLLPHLTVNLGLRWDVEVPPVEATNLTCTFRPNVQSSVVPSAPVGQLFVGDSGVPRGITSTRYHHVSPRIGIAWDPFGDGKTAVRAGAGIFYGSVAMNEWNQPANALPFAVRQTFNPVGTFSNPYANTTTFPNGDPFPYTYNPKSPRYLPNAAIETIDQNYQWPLTYQLNAAVERQLPGQVSLTVAYVGNLMHDIPFSTDANYPVYSATATSSNTNARRPYNNNGSLGQVQFQQSFPTGSFHSMQITAHRPMTHNLMLNGFYVWSHSFESANGAGTGIGGQTQDYDNMLEERGPTDYDRRHITAISGEWAIEYYHGSSLLLKEALNGWKVSPIVSLQSGAPVNMTTGTEYNYDGYSNERPNLVAGQNAFLDPHRCRICAGGTAAQWFNTLAFSKNAQGAGIGPLGIDGSTPRDYLRAPGYRDIDLGLLRDIHFERGIVLELRGEAINAFNLVSLSGPTANLSSGNDGKITSASTPRLIQVGGRLTF